MKSAFAREFELEGGRERRRRRRRRRGRAINILPVFSFAPAQFRPLNPLLVNCIRTDGDLFSFVDVSA